MKLGFNISLFLLVFFSLSTESVSLTDYQIKKYCRKEKNVFSCIKELEAKKSNLQKGKFIEIPVVPYKR